MKHEFKQYPFTAKRYEAKLPALTDGAEAKRRGRDRRRRAGGARPGAGLANHGVASVLIEADDSVCFGSRAICISRRSLEIIERLGGRFWRRAGLDGRAQLLPGRRGASFPGCPTTRTKLPPMLNIEQYYIEQFLLDAAEQGPT